MIRIVPSGVNPQGEELLDGTVDSLRLGLGGKSRMSREAPVRFCEGPGVKFPRATRRNI